MAQDQHMLCPQCHSDNAASSLRCMQCGSVLPVDTQILSAPSQKAARSQEARHFSIWGGLAGMVVAFVLLQLSQSNLQLDDHDLQWGSLIGAAVGALLGRYAAYRKGQP